MDYLRFKAQEGPLIFAGNVSLIIQSKTLSCASKFGKQSTGPLNIKTKYIVIDTCRLPNQNLKKKY